MAPPDVHADLRERPGLKAGILDPDLLESSVTSADVIVTGTFEATADFDPSAGTLELTSAGGDDIFVASYSPGGAHRWSRRFGGTSGDRGNGVVVDGNGNVTVTGFFGGTVDFGGGALTSAGGSDIFVASYTPSGVPLVQTLRRRLERPRPWRGGG